MTDAPKKINVNKHGSSDALVARLISCLPAATFEMETLCRLAGIKVSREIPSAAVECTFRPRLLLNPDFVEKYCARDEHLFLLVMHELWHIILAHTRLYPRGTMAHNIAFDAVINSGLIRQFNAPEFRGFFEAINKADEFPGCLLRPPEGWPANPTVSDQSARRGHARFWSGSTRLTIVGAGQRRSTRNCSTCSANGSKRRSPTAR